MQIRRALQPAVEELEAIGFVAVEPAEWRYRKIARGKWEVTFERGDGKPSAKHAGARRSQKAPLPKPGAAKEGGVERQLVRDYLAALPGEERQRLETDDLGEAEPFLRTLLGSGGALGKTSSEVILHRHVMKILGK